MVACLKRIYKEALEITVPLAKSLARSNTGKMRNSINVIARRPTDRDKRSKYIYDSDAAIAVLSVKKSAVSLGEEFGTAKKSGKPFIRPALESNKTSIINSLGSILNKQIEKYRSKNQKDKK